MGILRKVFWGDPGPEPELEVAGRLREIIAGLSGVIVDTVTESCYWMGQAVKARRENEALRQTLADIESAGRLEKAKRLAREALKK